MSGDATDDASGVNLPANVESMQIGGSDIPDAGLNLHLNAPSAASDYQYKTNYANRGYFVIINNVEFEKRTGMNSRKGSDKDATSLKMRFAALGFRVESYRNQSVKQMRDIFSNYANSKSYNENSDCFACAILSHGDLGIVYGTDSYIQLEDLAKPFQGDSCPQLAGKPKIFIVQACRGNKFDDGARVEHEVCDAESENPGVDDLNLPAGQTVFKIPSLADFVYAYSTVPGFFSWRNSDMGSWFIQALCEVLQKYGKERDFLWMLTRTNLKVAYKFESNTNDPWMKNKKQIPCIASMLTRDLYFRDKE